VWTDYDTFSHMRIDDPYDISYEYQPPEHFMPDIDVEVDCDEIRVVGELDDREIVDKRTADLGSSYKIGDVVEMLLHARKQGIEKVYVADNGLARQPSPDVLMLSQTSVASEGYEPEQDRVVEL